VLSHPMEKIDGEIIELLRENARMKNTDIARTIGLTEGAIRARIANMVKRGTIRRFTVETEPLGVEGIVLIGYETERSREIMLMLRAISNRVYETSGDFDAAAMIQSVDMDHFNATVDRIREIPGIVRTSTLVRLA